MSELVRVNKMNSCYFCPLAPARLLRRWRSAFRNPVETYIACWEWGKYLGEEALAKAWTSASPVGPASRRIPCPRSPKRRELHELAAHSHGGASNGYAEGIALDTSGYVSEGSGENIFVVRDGKIHTPPLGRPSCLVSRATR